MKLCEQHPSVICFDIGGTSIKYGMFSAGKLRDCNETPTPADGMGVVEAVLSLIRQSSAACVGISTCGEVDDNGRILLSDNIPGYTGLPLAALLQQGCGLPAVVINDVNAAALGEMAFGAAGGQRDFLMLTYGTGIGGAIILNGQLYKGHSGSAGEFGGLIIHPEAIVPGDIGSGSYERCASAAALIRNAKAYDTSLVGGHAVFARKNEAAIQQILQNWLLEVCYGLIGVIHSFNPSLVVLGGGIMAQEGLCKQLEEKLLPFLKPSFQNLRLLPAALGNHAGLYGAAAMAIHEWETKQASGEI